MPVDVALVPLPLVTVAPGAGVGVARATLGAWNVSIVAAVYPRYLPRTDAPRLDWRGPDAAGMRDAIERARVALDARGCPWPRCRVRLTLHLEGPARPARDLDYAPVIAAAVLAAARVAPALVTARCAACGATFEVHLGETADAARDRHSLSPDCDGAERRAAFEATLYGRGVADGSQEYDPDEY